MNNGFEMTIYLHKTDDPFARIPKDLLNDKSLSWKAKGILSYLLGKKQGWKAQVQDIVNHGADGEEAVRSGLKELRTAGYAKLFRLVGEHGKAVEWVLKVADTPIFIKSEPDPGKPASGKARTWESQRLGNTDLSKKEESKIEESKNVVANATTGVTTAKTQRDATCSVNGNGWHPSSDQLRLNALYNRKPETKWSDKELKAFKSRGQIPEDEMSLIEHYYRAIIEPSKDYRRRDLCTLLNNFLGEVDRARKFSCNGHGVNGHVVQSGIRDSQGNINMCR